MSADQAFDNLMHQNALIIPVAASSSPGLPPPGSEAAPPSRRPESAVARESAMRVEDLIGDEASDYLPRGGAENSEYGTGGDYSRPTETDLVPVTGGELDDDVASAIKHGAKIVGRDSRPMRARVDIDTGENGEDTEEYRRTAIADDRDAEAVAAGELRIDRARRLRRFGYLPLSGMEDFENSARDMVASLAALDPDRPSLAIAGVVRGEGRTELAVRVALAIAKRVGHRVLLADFDVRRPQVAARLGVSSKHFTLADVLRGACALGEALAVSEEDNLYVLPARASDRDGDEILDGRQAERLFSELHHAFDFTIIDCGPVSHADAMIPCRLAGFTALVGRCGFSPAIRLNEAGERLEAAGARVAGLLLTGA